MIKIGLDIIGMFSKKDYHYGYTALHLVRYLAVKTAGFEGNYMDFSKEQHGPNSWLGGDKFSLEEKEKWKPIWDQYPQFYQLLHFSDAEGLLVPEWFLENVKYKHSFNLGSLDKLVSELELIKESLARHPEKYNDEAIGTWASKPFWSLYDLAKDELEEYGGILKFS